jgi:dipeptidyl aminopeptidase/acylaminoacyl peptidase
LPDASDFGYSAAQSSKEGPSMRKPILAPIVFALLSACCAFQNGQPPPLIPRQILFGQPERTNPQISPDGKLLAYLTPDANSVVQIWVRTLGTQDDRQLTAEKTHSIWHYTWTYSPNKLLFAQDFRGDENWQIYLLDAASGAIKNLTPYQGVQSRLVAVDPLHPDELIVAMNLRNRRFHDAYRLNIETGETLMVSRNGGLQVWWTPDWQFRVLTASTTTGLLIRESPRAPWKNIRRWPRGTTGALLGPSRERHTIHLISSPQDGNTEALLEFDLATGAEKVIAHDPEYDAHAVFTDFATRQIQAVAFQKEKLRWQVLDPSIAEDFAALAKINTGEFTVVHPYGSPMLPSRSLGRRDLQDKYWIVSYERDNGPTYHYLYERQKKTATLLFADRPKLENFKLAAMQPISFKSRDDLTIHGYLTLPVGVPAKNLPVVVLVHGGPWSRDQWGYSGTVQWLANRGYGVLQVNYRGSTGYGRNFIIASYKEWGAKMHDDIVDGTRWLIESGIADPKRTAIMGASFGGYATLVGLTLTPEIFTAGVSRVGISSLLTVAKNRPPYWSPWRGMYALRVGDPVKDEEMLRARSPLYFADRVQKPLLIAHGANDVRVVAQESEQMVQALREANKPVDYFVYEDEGHGINRSANRHHFHAKAEEFLARHLGGRLEPITDIPGHSGMEK